MSKENNITWFQVNNVVPLVGSAVMIAGSFFALSSQVALLSQKVDQIKDDTKTIVAEAKTGTERINNHEVRIALLEQKKTTQRIAPTNITSLPQMSPAPGPTPDRSAVVIQMNSNPEAKGEPSVDRPTPTLSPSPTPVLKKVIENIKELVKN